MEAQLAKIVNYAKSHLAKDATGHGFDHAKRVASLAEKIMADITDPTIDSFVVIASAYLHDTIDDKVVADSEVALEELQEYLVAIEVPMTKILEILFIIDNLSFSKEMFETTPELTINGQIVQDADRLDALGAIGILRTAYFGGAHGNILYDPSFAPRQLTTKTEYRKPTTVINHFYEKLFIIPEKMKTEYGKKEALRRLNLMEAFLEEFFKEWNI